MIGTRGYTVLGWVVYKIGTRVLKQTAKEKVKVKGKGKSNRAKLSAAGVIALVLVGGAIAARSASSD